MKKDTLPLLITAIVIIIVAGLIGGYMWMNNNSTPVDNMATNQTANTNSATTSTATSTNPIPTVTQISSGVSKNKTVPTANYQQTLTAYRDRRIQFDNCTAAPYSATYKNGTNVMLDNRSADPQEIHLNTKVVRLDSYEYKIVKLSVPKAPATISIDCTMLAQPAYNVGTILLQP